MHGCCRIKTGSWLARSILHGAVTQRLLLLQPFKHLQWLDLAGNGFAAFGGLAASTSLKWLSLAHNALPAVPQLDIPELQARRQPFICCETNKHVSTCRTSRVPDRSDWKFHCRRQGLYAT